MTRLPSPVSVLLAVISLPLVLPVSSADGGEPGEADGQAPLPRMVHTTGAEPDLAATLELVLQRLHEMERQIAALEATRSEAAAECRPATELQSADQHPPGATQVEPPLGWRVAGAAPRKPSGAQVRPAEPLPP